MSNNQIKSKRTKKEIGKYMMIFGLIGILYFTFLDPLLVIRGCFGPSIFDMLNFAIPIAMMIFGYRIYSKNE